MDKKEMYKRQERTIDHNNWVGIQTHILGVGSIGSFMALTITKMGIGNICLYDGDNVQEHNIPNQFFRHYDVDTKKVHAIKNIITHFTGIEEDEIHTIEDFIRSDSNLLSRNIGTDNTHIFLICTDSIESRKEIYMNIKGFLNEENYKGHLIDIRMGGEAWELFAINLNNEDERIAYEKTLERKAKPAPCGQSHIIYNILNVCSEATKIYKMIVDKTNTVYALKRDMNKHTFLRFENNFGKESDNKEKEDDLKKEGD